MNKKLEKALNDQMNFEIYSAHIYLGMAGYVASIGGLSGFENWLFVQYEEEVFHAKKFFHYINERGGRVEIKGFEDPANEYESLLDVFNHALEHEQLVTSRINDLFDLSIDECDHATRSFLQWFLDEQVEEENTVRDLIDKIKLVKDSGLYLLDQELATRTFVAPAE